jgi:sulfopyruvate decarboxylase subunit alpha
MSVNGAYAALVENRVGALVGVPDSLLSPLCLFASKHRQVRYIQTCDEATAVGVAAGMTLASGRSLVVMENSGLRRACESLSRLTLSHGMHVALLLSHRGEFGEPNWWGIAHRKTMYAHLQMLDIPFSEVQSTSDFSIKLKDAYAMLDTGQCTVALITTRQFTEELKERH